MGIPTIHVGCRHFALGRLQALINSQGLEPVACVDLEVEGAKKAIGTLQNVPEGLAERVYPSLGEAFEKYPAEVCLIYASTTAHAALVCESLKLGMHTLCVKPIAINQEEFRRIIATHKKHPHLMLVQGQNKRWNPAASKMREWLQNEIGELLGGECRFWHRQNLWTGPDSRQPDAFVEGLFFHAGCSHQIDQLVAAKGLPRYVTAVIHRREEHELGQTGVWGTAGGQALMEYPNGAPVTYTGTRAAHADFAGWSGHWSFHGSEADIRREGGHLQLWRKGQCLVDLTLQDLHPGLIEDDRLQFDALAEALTTGKNREWIQETTLGTWILMEAMNESARKGERIHVEQFRDRLMA